MSNSSSTQPMIDNEVVFRNRNERLQQNFKDLKKVAKEDNQEHFLDATDNVLQFYCECSDENCQARISLKASGYNKIHKRRDRFVIKPGHETKQIERVAKVEPEYCIVEKLKMPSGAVTDLQSTDVDNT